MRVTYFDEVKANPQNGQDWYFVGGLSIPSEAMHDLEEKTNVLAEKVFGKRDLTPQTEFHASLIYFGRGPYRGMEPAQRVDILGQLAEIISSEEGVKRVYAAINTRKLYNAAQAPEIAFAHFCERVQMSLDGAKTLLIGDQDDQYAAAMIAAFAQYRAFGTPYPYGIEIHGLLDAVHFARSHHSRFLQLADVYLFLETHRWGSRKGWFADLLSKRLVNVELWAHRYKEWPR